METVVLNVEGMSCSHCEEAVKKAVANLGGINSVDVDLKAKTVTVVYNSAKVSIEQMKSEIEQRGYDVV